MGEDRIHSLDLIHHIQTDQCDDRQRTGQTIHTITAVCHIDGYPYKNNGQNTEDHRRDRDTAAEDRKLYNVAVKVQKCNGNHDRNGEIQKPFLEFSPRGSGTIVQKSCHHGGCQ